MAEQPRDWLGLFGSAYEVAEDLAFGGYWQPVRSQNDRLACRFVCHCNGLAGAWPGHRRAPRDGGAAGGNAELWPRRVQSAGSRGDATPLSLSFSALYLLSHALLAARSVQYPERNWQIAAAVTVVGLPPWRVGRQLAMATRGGARTIDRVLHLCLVRRHSAAAL